MRNDMDILRHILQCCAELEEIKARCGDSPEAFRQDAIYRHAAAMCLLRIGTLASSLTEDFKAEHRMPWQSTIALSRHLAHYYDSVDICTLHESITQDIPALQACCAAIVQQYQEVDMSIKDRYQTELTRLRVTPDDQNMRDTIREYTNAMAEAPDFLLVDPADRYKLLAQHGNHVLCGRDDGPALGFTFVTWLKANDGNGVIWGHYWEDYTAAKQDFAVRAGLVQERELFSPEQKQAIFRAVHHLLQDGPDMTDQEVSLHRSILDKLADNSGPTLAQEPEMEMGV